MSLASPPATRLDRAFFSRDARVVARDLLGRVVRTELPEGATAGRIVEAEAYRKSESTSHSSRGRTERTRSMFEDPGTLYVYFIYGMHYCMNFVCDAKGAGAAVLIRALEPVEGLALMRARRGPKARDEKLCAGPGSLCKALGVDRSWDGIDLVSDPRMSVLEGTPVPDTAVLTTPRIGVVGRPEDVALPWRWRVAPDPHRVRHR